MRKNKNNYNVVLALLGSLVACYTIYLTSTKAYHVLHSSLFSIESISYSVENLYSSSLHKDITSFLDKKLADKDNNLLNGDGLYKTTTEHFPMIETVTWKQNGPHLHINLIGSPLVSIVNENYVACKNHYLMQCKLIDEKNLSNLPSATIAQQCISNSYISNNVGHCFFNIPTWLLESFSIDYQTPSKIILRPLKEMIHLTEIIANEATLNDKNMRKVMNHLAYIKKDCLNENQGKRNMILDIRFKKRIVVKKHRG